MTGHMPVSSPFPPVWQFDAPTDSHLSSWEPPTTPLHRRQKRERRTLSGLLTHLLDCFGRFPSLKPPLALDLDAAVSIHDHEPEHATPDAPQPVLSDIAHLRSAICDSDTLDDVSLRPLFTSCASSLCHKLDTRRLPLSALDAAVLDPLDLATRRRIPQDPAIDELIATFRTSILNALKAAQADGRDNEIRPSLWLSFAQRVCTTPGKLHDVRLFARLMRTMPASLRAQVPPDHIAQLARAVVTDRASGDDVTFGWSDHARSFIDAVQELTSAQRQDLDCDMRWFLLRQDKAARRQQRLSVIWLFIKAHDAHATTDHLLGTYSQVAEPNTHIRSMHLCRLLTARFIATGVLEAGHGRLLLETRYETPGHRWMFLILALSASAKKDESLRDLCSFLTGIGELDRMILSLTKRGLPPCRAQAVRAIAIACDDHSRAVQLHDALVAVESRARIRDSWNWTLWARYTERMIKDPTMDTWRIWDLLGLMHRIPPTNHLVKPHSANFGFYSDGEIWRPDPGSELAAKIRLLDQMSTWFIEATHMNERQQQRELEVIIYIQRGLTGVTTSEPLNQLAKVLTKDLSCGRLGRTVRLEFLVALVAKFQGIKKAQLVSHAIRGWRWTVAREYRKMKSKKLQEEAEQKAANEARRRSFMRREATREDEAK